MRVYFMAAVAVALAMPALAEDVVTTSFKGEFEDATFALENAIVGQGLVVDYVSHVGDMLERTREDVGSTVQIFKNADVFLFCSANVSREVMEADPMNIAHCPYSVFAAETDAGVVIGRRDYPDGPMEKVEQLLDKIIAEAAGN